jgi:pimeloyl-ACP methyl ester carboxylesterase
MTRPRPMPHVEGVTHRDVIANGVRLHVAEAGSPEAEAVLMLHGWPQHWWEWRELIPPLAERYRVICPDLRGFGWSEVPRGRYEPEVFAADVVALLDALGIDRVRLIGHDWGGWTGYVLCLRHLQRIQRYLALNIIHPWLRMSPRLAIRGAWRLWYQAVLGIPGLSPAMITRTTHRMNRRIAASSVDPSCWQGGVVETFTDQFRERERAWATSKLYRWALSPKGTLALARGHYRDLRLTVPTLHLHGTEDVAIPVEALAGWESHAADMRLELVPDCGHFIADERPELVLDRALEFFAAD